MAKADKQGYRTAPVRRRLRSGMVTLLTVVPVLGGTLPAAAAPAGGPAASGAPAAARPAAAADRAAAAPAAPGTHPAAPSDSRTAHISLNGVTPQVPGKGDTVTISGTVTNRSDTTLTEGHIGLRVGPALNSRSSIEQAARRTGYLSGADAPELDGHEAEIGTLKPGITRSFRLRVPVADLGLSESGVYQLGVSLGAQTRARPYEQVLGIGRTFLPWQPEEPAEKTRLTFLWPLVADSHLTARTGSDEQQTPVFRNDDLAEAVAPGGRLQRMVALGADLPITWVVDPDLLASVEAMTGKYEVRTGNGDTVPGKGQEAANDWLSSLQDAVEGEDVVALPFGDPDLASLAHQGKQVPGTIGGLGPATRLARTTVDSILHTEPSTDFAWPVEGALDTSVVDVATSAGAHNVIARSDTFGTSESIPYTPTAARPVGGGTTAVVADHRLSTAFDGDLARADAATGAVQRFLAHTLSITQQVPSRQRSIVVAPQRQPTASQAQTMATALRALDGAGRGAWTQHTGLAAAAKAKPDPAAHRTVPGPGAYPQRLRAQELPETAFTQLQETQAKLEDFAGILSQEDRVVPPFQTAMHRALSTSWRGEAEQAAEYRAAMQDHLVSLTRKVKLIDKSDLTLSGRSATIPVTVQNNLLQGVDGLRLKLTSSRSIGLRIQDDMQQVVVDGGHSQSVTFDTSAKANGRTTLTAQLYTEEGKPYGPAMTFRVKVTSITSTVLLVIAGGVLLVVLAGIRMYTQRKRNGTAPDPDAPLEPAPGAAPSSGAEDAHRTQEGPAAQETAGDLDGRPDERPEDTTAGSTPPRDTGEKVDR
ncbi:DUF6049 family protein [Streptomyces sp. JJ36]|uniref:DUF6049 family protein n=1 Tax=Streptomyces sp. JJ36 TaxID=2736645 RepID=UPI0027E4A011|nr:DUF6049 family protein [Streptomyces sp. JJ36]